MMMARQPKQGYKEAIEAIDDAVKNMSEEVSPLNEPHCEITGLRGFQPGPTQTLLYNHTRWLEA